MHETKRQAFQRALRTAEKARGKVTATDLDTDDGRALGTAIEMFYAVDAGTIDATDDRVHAVSMGLFEARCGESNCGEPDTLMRARCAAECCVLICQVRTDAEASTIADDAEEIESGTRPEASWQVSFSPAMVDLIRGTIAKFKATVAELGKPQTDVTFPISAGGAREDADREMRAIHKQGAIDALTTLLTVAGIELEAVETPPATVAL